MKDRTIKSPSIVWLTCIIFLYSAYLGVDEIARRFAELPTLGSNASELAPRPALPPRIYPLLARSQEPIRNPAYAEAPNYDAVFGRIPPLGDSAPKPPIPMPATPAEIVPTPDFRALLARVARITAVSDSGVFVDGRFYVTGEDLDIPSIRSVLGARRARLTEIRGCKLAATVGAERFEWNGC